jgi:hypothetical protein
MMEAGVSPPLGADGSAGNELKRAVKLELVETSL